MKFKLKISKKGKPIYMGHEILEAPEGTIFKIISGPDIGDIVIRIDTIDPKLVTIIRGGVIEREQNYWGPILTSYIFEHLIGVTEENVYKKNIANV